MFNVERVPKTVKFNWQLPIGITIAIAALLAFLALTLWASDFGPIIYIFVLAPIVSVILLVFAVGNPLRQTLLRLSILAAYCATSWWLF